MGCNFNTTAIPTQREVDESTIFSLIDTSELQRRSTEQRPKNLFERNCNY